MIICEIGQNHCGDMNLAKNLIELAKGSGADLVKFQLYDHKILYADHPEIPNVELTYAHAKMLFDHGEKIGIEVFFSVFDVERVRWCEKIGVKRYKITRKWASMDMLTAINKIRKPVLITLGRHIATSFPSHLYAGNDDGRILYPCPLFFVDFINVCFCHEWSCEKEHYDGFSDHTIGLDAAKIALARGAEIIEKHFAINHHTGIDAPWSMTPDELRELKEWESKVKEVLCPKELVRS